jgi:hypothetical protein
LTRTWQPEWTRTNGVKEFESRHPRRDRAMIPGNAKDRREAASLSPA